MIPAGAIKLGKPFDRRLRVRQKAILGAICSAALLMPAAPAAARPPIPTSITRDTAGIVGTNLYSIGHLSSPNPKCVAHRTVKLVYFLLPITGWSTQTRPALAGFGAASARSPASPDCNSRRPARDRPETAPPHLRRGQRSDHRLTFRAGRRGSRDRRITEAEYGQSLPTAHPAPPSVLRFVAAFELVIDGESPQPFLRQMEKSGAVRVLGPQIDGIHHGAPGAMRMVVRGRGGLGGRGAPADRGLPTRGSGLQGEAGDPRDLISRASRDIAWV